MHFTSFAEDDIYTKAFKTSGMFHFNPYDLRILITFTIVAIIDWSSKMIVELFNSFLFTSLTRGIQDLVGIIFRDINENILYRENHIQQLDDIDIIDEF